MFRFRGLNRPRIAGTLWDGSAPVLPIVFLTGHGDIPMSVRAIKAGADDFLTKPISSEDLLHAIEKSALPITRMLLDQKRKARRFARPHRLQLTRRANGKVFELVVRGKINKQIAFTLGTTERTIKAHRP